MLFREDCVKFLDSVVTRRAESISKAIDTALKNEYEPYANELNSSKENLIAQETRKKQELIASIEYEYAQKVHHYNVETEQKLAEKKKEITAKAEMTAKYEYDKFIADFTKLAEQTKLN